MDWTLALYVALGGAIGSVARYALTVFIESRQPSPFPVATLIINVTGSLLLGFLARWFSESVSLQVRLLVLTGFCGGYTTFSTFSFETMRLWQQGDYRRGTLYVVSSVVLSLAGAFAGVALARAARQA